MERGCRIRAKVLYYDINIFDQQFDKKTKQTLIIIETLNICEANNQSIPIKYDVAKVAQGIKFTEL